MKKLYKCEVTDKIFDNKLDCQESEYKNGNKKKEFVCLVHSFIEAIKEKHNVHSIQYLNIADKAENYYNDRMVYYRSVSFDFMMNDKLYKYERYSDEVGDYRWDWHIEDNVDSFIFDFEKEFIMPNIKEFEGKLNYDFLTNTHNIVWSIDNLETDTIFNAIGDKRIKITVLED